MVSAEYGGTGGKPIVEYLCVEEPDIEIGAGVSSKGTLFLSHFFSKSSNTIAAISRRMQTDKSGSAGPRSSREPPQRYRQPNSDRRDHERENTNNNNMQVPQVPPTVPSFNFQFPMIPGSLPFTMPPGVNLPPGFVMPGQNQTQPPPPGANQ